MGRLINISEASSLAIHSLALIANSMEEIDGTTRFYISHVEEEQEQLANKIGINRSMIGAYEEGRAEPKMQTLLNICYYFDVDINSLILIQLIAFSHSAFF